MESEPFKSANGGPKYGYQASNHFDQTTSAFPSDRPNAPADNGSAIMIRKLPSSTSKEALKSLLIFTKDLISVEQVSNRFPEDSNHLTAIARFHTSTAANEARSLLNGKPNTTGDAEMIVDIVMLSPGGSFHPRRNTMEQRSPDSLNGGSGNQLTRQSSKFNDTFQALDRVSPPRVQSFSNGELPNKMFSPQSPTGQPLERQRVSGKSVIEDGDDDETGKLLNDSVAHAQNDMATNMSNQLRRPNIPKMPTGRFASMSLNNPGMVSPPGPGLISPRGPVSSSTSFGPPGIPTTSPNQNYQLQNAQFSRYSNPPANPADQNPPCNTLYVGNLPVDTSEDELKSLFSKQRGYRRLCFRAKTNGPMCFVEFEDITAATKALDELYGRQLTNSIKGGIRLSFSKNPLGVRAGQPVPLGLSSLMSPQSPVSGMTGIGRHSFTAANRPPPGLACPPGLINTNGANMNVLNGLASPHAAPMNGVFNSPLSPVGTTGMRSPTTAPISGGWDGPQRAFHDYLGER